MIKLIINPINQISVQFREILSTEKSELFNEIFSKTNFIINKSSVNVIKSRKKCLIVDEVDNMCLDRARHVLYLSHQIQSLKWIESLFIFIWIAVLRTEIDNPNDLSGHTKNIAKFIQQNIDNKNIFLPEYLKEFVKYKIPRWIDSAFQARFMREDDHFVLDKDIGVEQYSTKWSHGLAQF